MPREVHGSGPMPARVMIVGEAPGAEEEASGKPFVGMSGRELDRMLGEAGIARSECYVTNVCRIRPPGNDIAAFIAQTKKEITNAHVNHNGKFVLPPIIDGLRRLHVEIESVNPSIIIALGNTSLWALTGRWGITKWRGSMLTTNSYRRGDGTIGWGGTGSGDINPLVCWKVIPTLHPAAVLRQWNLRATTVHDLRRAARFRDGSAYPTPAWAFTVRPSLDQTLRILESLLSRASRESYRLSFDLETRAAHIACAGLAWSYTDAICIPFMTSSNNEGYWSEEEEALIVMRLYQLLTHPKIEVIGQNLLYDAQYTYRHWLFVPRVVMDTMIAQHSLFSDLPKSLAYICSIYCSFYQFWKEDK